MKNIIYSEVLKNKRTLARYVFIFTPMILLLFTLMSLHNTQNPSGMYNDVPVIQWSFFNLWPFLLAPLILVLGMYFNLKIDNKSRFIPQSLANNWSLSSNLTAKLLVLMLYFLLSTLVFVLITLLSIYLTTKSMPNITLILTTALLMYVVQCCLIPWYLCLLKFLNVILVLIFSAVMSFIAAITVLGKFYWLIPQGYALKVAMITMGIHPNGVPMEANSADYLNYVGDYRALLLVICSSLVMFLLGYALNRMTLNFRLE